MPTARPSISKAPSPRSWSARPIPRWSRSLQSSSPRRTGKAKQDCEINAAKRWLAAHAGRYATDNDSLLGDGLYAHQPFCLQVLLRNFHFLFTCKPSSRAHLQGWVEALPPGRGLLILKLRVKGQSNRWEHWHYRWANQVPLTEGADPLKVTWCELTVSDGEGAEPPLPGRTHSTSACGYASPESDSAAETTFLTAWLSLRCYLPPARSSSSNGSQ